MQLVIRHKVVFGATITGVTIVGFPKLVACKSSGNSPIHRIAAIIEPIPSSNRAGTTPNRETVNPDSDSPS